MSWAQWPGPPAQQPPIVAAAAPLLNPAPAVLPPGMPYASDQWTQMQQQNWQQWAQWQQQYQQWHQQYGAEYQKSINALAQQTVVGAPPPLPVEPQPQPPLPKDEVPKPAPPLPVPVPPPQQSQYTTQPPIPNQFSAPPPAFTSNVPPQAWKANANVDQKRPLLGKEDSLAKRQMTNRQGWQNPGVPQATGSNEELSEAEKKFDKQFAEWEAQFNKWKEQNSGHPDKQQYKEYEKKWEQWRQQLLDRREAMRRKRLGLPPIKPSQGQNFNVPPPAQTTAAPPQPQQPLKAVAPPAANMFNKPPPTINNEPLQFKGGNKETETQESGLGFLNTSKSDGIPGLDLVKDSDVITIEENEERAPPQKGPDLEAISKGINNILGDQKLMSMLSMVSQNQGGNMGNNFPKISGDVPTSRDQSNTSVDDARNDHPEPIQNFDDQTRSSFTMQPNDAEYYRTPASNSRFGMGVPPPSRYDSETPFNRPPPNFALPSGDDMKRPPPGRFGQELDKLSLRPQNTLERPHAGSFRRGDTEMEPERNVGFDRGPGMERNDFGRGLRERTDFDHEMANRNFDRNLPARNSFGRQYDTKDRDVMHDDRDGRPNQRFGPGFRGVRHDLNDMPGGDFNKPPPSNFRDGGIDDFNGPPPSNFRDVRDDFSEPPPNSFRDQRSSFGRTLQSNFRGGRDDFDEPPPSNFRGVRDDYNAPPPDFRASREAPPPPNFNGPPPNFNGRNNDIQRDNFGRDNYPDERSDRVFEGGRFNRSGGFGAHSRMSDDAEYPPPPAIGGAFGRNDGPVAPNAPEPPQFDRNNFEEERFEEMPPEDYLEPPVQEDVDIWKPVTVVDYDHKRVKPPEIDVLVEPFRMYDYRHRPLNRIPYPERPNWLSDAVRMIPEFDPPIIRKPPIERRMYDDRFDPSLSRREDRYRPDDRLMMYDRKGYDPKYGGDDWLGRDRRRSRSPPRFDRHPAGPNREPWEQGGRPGDRRPMGRKWENDDFDRERRDRKDDRDRRIEEGWKKGETGWDERRNWRSDDMELDDVDAKNDRFKTDKRNVEKETLGKKEASSVFPFSKPIDETKPSNVTLIEDILNPPGRMNRPQRIVIILRGPPGSGKTHLAKMIKDKEVENGGSAPRILSLDDYFMVEHEKEGFEDGKRIKLKEMVYEFEAEMEESYRNSLVKSFKKTITDGYFPFIIVDNVNDKVKYFGEMWSFAKQNGFQVYICQLELDLQNCTKRNIHNRSEEEIRRCIEGWETTPSHHPILDATSLLQGEPISEVEMEVISSPISEADDNEDGLEDRLDRSKWDNFDCSINNLARLDGVSKPPRPSRTMEEFLQLDDEWEITRPTKPGQKRVRWADLEERKQQEKMRAIGFVVGQTDWDRMMDPSMGQSALTQTKYIEKVQRRRF